MPAMTARSTALRRRQYPSSQSSPPRSRRRGLHRGQCRGPRQPPPVRHAFPVQSSTCQSLFAPRRFSLARLPQRRPSARSRTYCPPHARPPWRPRRRTPATRPVAHGGWMRWYPRTCCSSQRSQSGPAQAQPRGLAPAPPLGLSRARCPPAPTTLPAGRPRLGWAAALRLRPLGRGCRARLLPPPPPPMITNASPRAAVRVRAQLRARAR